jgi:membrane peptidoglycan carboxypeptidase
MTSIRYPLLSTRLGAIVISLIAFTFPMTSLAKARGKEGKPKHTSARNSRPERRGKATGRSGHVSMKRLSKRERRRLEARLRAARRAAIARQRAFDEAIRGHVRSLISKDDTAGENPEIRRLAVNALGNHAGTVVVMNPKTGQVLTIVNQQWGLREGFKPCSTIKLVTGLAGLNEGVIDPTSVINISDSNGVGLTQAMAYSKNDYFQQVGGRVGFDKMLSYARTLGLGERTGINLRNEFEGQVPEFKAGYALNHMSSHGDDFKVTALQLATLVSAIANGGKLLKPFIVEKGQQTSSIRRQVHLEPETWKSILPGMIGSVSYGSGRRAFDPQVTVAGKTGTCIEDGSWVGLFTSFAPVNDPQLAVVVISRGTDARNHFPASVAGQIYRSLNLSGAPNIQVASRPELKNQSAGTSESSVDEDEAELDANDESIGAEENDSASGISSSRAPAAAAVFPSSRQSLPNPKVKPVLMVIPQRTTVVRPSVLPASTPSKSPGIFRRERREIDDKQ